MSAYASALVEVQFIDENVGFVSGSDEQGAVILKTTDGGDSWTKIYSAGEYGDYVWKLQIFPDNKIIFGSIESETQGKLLKTFDGGLTWQTKISLTHMFRQLVLCQLRTVGWAATIQVLWRLLMVVILGSIKILEVLLTVFFS
jgi:hypothetical protein